MQYSAELSNGHEPQFLLILREFLSGYSTVVVKVMDVGRLPLTPVSATVNVMPWTISVSLP